MNRMLKVIFLSCFVAVLGALSLSDLYAWDSPAKRDFGLVKEFTRPNPTGSVEEFKKQFNPGDLNMYLYVPANMPANAPLVVAMHGCNQAGMTNPFGGSYMGSHAHAESFNKETGWTKLADKYKFYVVFPEENRRATMKDEKGLNKYHINNDFVCFAWAGFYGNNRGREEGEKKSIIQMIEWVKNQPEYSVDENKIFATGFSAGGAMAVALGATWPDLFTGVATSAGVAFNCANQFEPSGDTDNRTVDNLANCMGVNSNFQPLSGCSNEYGEACMQEKAKHTPEEWGSYVREKGYPGYNGEYPTMFFWQGDKDQYVSDDNLGELMKQWTNVHNIDQTPDNHRAQLKEGHKGHIYKEYRDDAGELKVATVEVTNMKHGVSVDPGNGEDQGGFDAGAHGMMDLNWGLNTGLYFSYYTLKFWGLIKESGPTVKITYPVDGATNIDNSIIITADVADRGNVDIQKVDFYIDGKLEMTVTAPPFNYTWDTKNVANGKHTIKVVATNAMNEVSEKEIVVYVRDAGFACKEWTATNINHKSQGRATVDATWKNFFAVGSNDPLGGMMDNTTVKEVSKGFFKKGKCSER